MIGHADEAQLGLVALRAYTMQAGHRLGTCEERIQVGSAAEHDAVEAVEQTIEQLCVAIGRDDHRHAADMLHRRIIPLGQFATFGAKVARNSDDRPALSGRRECAERSIEACFPVE